MHLNDVLTELVEQSGDRLLRVAYQLTHDAAAAQDLVAAMWPLVAAVSAGNGQGDRDGPAQAGVAAGNESVPPGEGEQVETEVSDIHGSAAIRSGKFGLGRNRSAG